MRDFLGVDAEGRLTWDGRTVSCVLGRSGRRADKREGDGATPIGRFPLRAIYYRPDREPCPDTTLPCRAIEPDMGWCDDPGHPDYNRPVRLPHPARHERLWRDDHLYDLLVVLGYNDAPPVSGRGSAIFLHLARPDGGPTEGCVAMAAAELRLILAAVQPGDALTVHPPLIPTA